MASAPRQTTMAITATNTGARNQVISTFGRTAPRICSRISTRATEAASGTMAAATKDIVIVREIMKVVAEDATGTAIGLAIVPAMIPGGDTGTLAKAIAERSQAIKQGAILVPLGVLSSALHRLGIPSVEIPDDQEAPASAPGNPEVPALVPETPASAQDPDAALLLGVPA